MTREEIISGLKFTVDMFLFDPFTGETFTEPRNDMDKTTIDACRGAIELLEQAPCKETVTEFADRCRECGAKYDKLLRQKSMRGHCRDCKYFEYDSVAKVDGIPLIVAHEICKKWGDGCKTREDGYCFLFEPKESEE